MCVFLTFFVLIGCVPKERTPLSVSLLVQEPTRREIIGERLYQRYCSPCHGTTGEGDGLHSYMLNPPPANHADTVHMNTLSDEHLFEIISDGGAGVGKSPEMPRWNTVLNKNDISNVIMYLRTFPHDESSTE